MAEKSAPAPSDTPAAVQPSDGAPAPHAAGSEPTGDAAPASAAPPAEPRGRGKRGPDKRPRARRAGAGSSESKGPGSPLGGSVDGDQEGRRGHVGPKDKKPKGTASASELLAMSSEELAAVAVGIGNAVIVRAAAYRYGMPVAAAHVSLEEAEAAQVVKLTAAYLDTVMIKMTAGEALAWSLVLLYGSKIAAVEMGAHKHGAPSTDDAYPKDAADRARDVTPKVAA